jgi:hypothetical protein
LTGAAGARRLELMKVVIFCGGFGCDLGAASRETPLVDRLSWRRR